MNQTGPAARLRGALSIFPTSSRSRRRSGPASAMIMSRPACERPDLAGRLPRSRRARPRAAAMALSAQGRAAYLALGCAQLAKSRHRRALGRRGRRPLQQRGCRCAGGAASRSAATTVGRPRIWSRRVSISTSSIPGLGYPDQARDVADSLARVGGPGRAKLWAGFSPSIVPAVRSTQAAPWSFAFIDGYHEGRAPLDDAEAVIGLMAEDASVMFHDLISPHVAAGLAHFQANGWNVGLYNTMQIMGDRLARRARARRAYRGREHAADRGGAFAGISDTVDRGLGFRASSCASLLAICITGIEHAGRSRDSRKVWVRSKGANMSRIRSMAKSTSGEEVRERVEPLPLAIDMPARLAEIDQDKLIRGRLARLRQGLAKADVAGALLSDPMNIRYATGTRNMSVWTLHGPGRYAFVPTEGPVVLFEFGSSKHVSRGSPVVSRAARQHALVLFPLRPAGRREGSNLGGRSDWPRESAWRRQSASGGGSLRAMGRSASGFAGNRTGRRAGRCWKWRASSRRQRNCGAFSFRWMSATSRWSGCAQRFAPGITENQLWGVLHETNIAHDGEWIECRLLASGERTNPWFQEFGNRVIEAGDMVGFDTDMVGPHGVSRRHFPQPDLPGPAPDRRAAKAVRDRAGAGDVQRPIAASGRFVPRIRRNLLAGPGGLRAQPIYDDGSRRRNGRRISEHRLSPPISRTGATTACLNRTWW